MQADDAVAEMTRMRGRWVAGDGWVTSRSRWGICLSNFKRLGVVVLLQCVVEVVVVEMMATGCLKGGGNEWTPREAAAGVG